MGRLARFIRFFTGDDQGNKPLPIYYRTVSGNAPLTLTNALASPIRSLVLRGYVYNDGEDYFCNNGKLTIVDDVLPVGYRRVVFIGFDGNFWYDTGEVLYGSDSVKMQLTSTSSSGQNVFGSYNGTTSGTKNYSLFIYGGGSTSKSYFRYGEQLARPTYGTGDRVIYLSGNGTTGFATDATVTPEEFTTEATAYIGMLPNSSSAAYTGTIVGSIIIRDRSTGLIRLEYVPCRRESDGVVGYYELVNGKFIEPIGTGTPYYGSYDNTHVHVEAVGTPEVLTVNGVNVTVPSLLAVDDEHIDEFDAVTGALIRRCHAAVDNNGQIYIYTITAEEEHLTPQPVSTAEGTNVVSVTSEVPYNYLKVEYAYNVTSDMRAGTATVGTATAV